MSTKCHVLLRWPYYTSLEFHKIKCRNQTSETIKDCGITFLRAIFKKLILKNYFLGRLVPYLERDWLRSLTPAQSNEPRTVW